MTTSSPPLISSLVPREEKLYSSEMFCIECEENYDYADATGLGFKLTTFVNQALCQPFISGGYACTISIENTLLLRASSKSFRDNSQISCIRRRPRTSVHFLSHMYPSPRDSSQNSNRQVVVLQMSTPLNHLMQSKPFKPRILRFLLFTEKQSVHWTVSSDSFETDSLRIMY